MSMPFPPAMFPLASGFSRGTLLLGLICGMSGGGVTASAEGQPLANPNPAGGPIDATIADRGVHSTSLRRVEPGIARHSFAARLTLADFGQSWTPYNPAQPLVVDPSTGLTHSATFQYRSPGLRALLDRPDYIRYRGESLALIPANTVFQLTPDTPAAPRRTLAPAHENYRNLRLNFRLADQPAPADDDAGHPRLDTSGFRFPAAADAAYLPSMALPQPRQPMPRADPTPGS